MLNQGEQYSSMRKLYVISILGDYLKVRDEEHPRTDVLLRRAEVRMNDTGKSLMDRQSFIFLQLPDSRREEQKQILKQPESSSRPEQT